MEQVPTVTTLLRASRDANEYLLKEVFRDILENGISRENLNSTDRSGRVSVKQSGTGLLYPVHSDFHGEIPMAMTS